jgi:predicted CXXCH cytochrome family protein
MKRTATLIAAVLAAAAALPGAADAQVQTQSKMLSTRHNLSVTGTGPIRAETEQQLCVFCHTPHVPAQNAARQLWNRPATTADYTLYSSDYLTSLNYDNPAQPNPRSKLCLSCHDGTIAIGAVLNNEGANPVRMLNDVTTMPEGSAGFIGTSLANDHPVGYAYNAAKDPELANRPWPWGGPVQLDPDDASGTVECMSCHDAHDDTHGKFLRMSNTDAALCTFCHQKAGWAESGHKLSTQVYYPPDRPQTTVGEWSCRSCHASHGGEGVPYLLPKVEEMTCYESGCHGTQNTGPGAKDIQSHSEKFYAHPTVAVMTAHRNPDTQESLGPSNRHAECQDCHNPHRAKPGIHEPRTNAVSGVLSGARGVQPGVSPIWTQPTSYTELSPAVTEGQICLRCHSSSAFGIVPDGVTTIVGPSGASITDQAMEFNPANRSAHPVMAPLLGQTGSSVPQALPSNALTPEWNNPGMQTMYCSDCHGPDQAVSPTVPAGPHGSSVKFMLTGRGKFWPENAAGSLWSLDDIRRGLNNWQNDLFCANCHPMVEGNRFVNDVHNKGPHVDAEVKCVTCHVAVPHGSKRSRLIGYASDPAPWNYLGAGMYEQLVIEGFSKSPDPNDYRRENCTMTGICHGTQVGIFED